MSLVPDFANELFEKIAQENGFINYSMKIELGTMPGDNFNSEIFSIKITENESSKKLELLSKIAPSSEARRKQFLSDTIFKREAMFYLNFVPLLEKFQEEKQLPECDQFHSFPKCYGAIIDSEKQHYVIVLEDLRPLGFKMWDKGKPTTLENARTSVRELGKFHAFSVALKHQKPAEFSVFKQLYNLIPDFLKSKKPLEMIENSFDRAAETLRNDDHKKIALHIKNNLLRFLAHCFDEKAGEGVGVLCHGDCWNNNLLFRFNEKGDAEDIRILDWQLCHFGSPAIDVLYILFSSTDRALREKEFKNLLKLYYDTFAKTVRLLGSDPDKLFNYDDLQDEMKIFGVYTLMLIPLILQVSQADSSEIADFNDECDKAAKGEGQVNIVTGLSAKGQLEYERRLNEVFEDIMTMGYF